MIDIHSHVLPALDDGAKDQTTTGKMLELAEQVGTTHIIATPHVLSTTDRPTWQTITEAVETQRTRLCAAGQTIEIYPGAEMELNWDMLALIQRDKSDYCLAGSRYILVELPSQTIPTYINEFLYEMQLREKIVIIAHPERHHELMSRWELLETWLQKGVLLQCNGGSFAGVFGPHAEAAAKRLLVQGWIHFLGSDAHTMGQRNTDMSEALMVVEELAGKIKRQELMGDNPLAILENRILPIRPIKPVPKKRKSWMGRLLIKKDKLQ